MSSRNNRVVRNRERNNNFDWNSNNIKIIASILVIIILISVIVIGIRTHNKSKVTEISQANHNDTYEYFLLYSGDNVGVVDRSGNEIVKPDYSEIYLPNPEKDVFFCIKDDDTYQIVNKENEELFNDFEEVSIIQVEEGPWTCEENVLRYKSDDKYGLIDLDGNIILQAEYDEISSLTDKPGFVLVEKDGKTGVADENGNIVIEIKYDSISSDAYCSADNWFDKAGFIVSEKSNDGVNFGYIDYKGNSILETKYESIERALEYESDDIYLIAMQKGKKGVFKDNKKIIDLNYQDIKYSDLSNVFIVNKNGKYGFCNNNGKVILKPEYTKYSIAGNYIYVEKETEDKLYDINGNLVNSASYKKMIETDNPSFFIAEDENGTYSIISKETTIDEKYSQVSYAFDNYFIFSDETGKTGVVNALTSEVEIEPEYDFILVIDGTKSLQAIDGINNLVEIYSSTLEKTLEMEDAIVSSLNNGYAVIYSETDMKYINSEGKIVQNTEVYPDEKIYATQENEKWGFSDNNGKSIVECEYDIVTEFNEYGFAGIKKDGKWGVVNEAGEIIIEPTYELDTYYFPQFIGKYILKQYETIYCEDPSQSEVENSDI